MQALPLSIGFLFLLLSIFALRRAVILRRLIARLIRLEEAPLASASGLALVRGRARPGPGLVSPLQRRPCAYFFFRVEEPREAQGKKPRQLATGKEWAELEIEDASGRARVEARAALVASPRVHTHEFRNLTTIPPEHAEFFERAGFADKHLPRFELLRVTEYTIEDGDELFVTGTVRGHDGEKVFYRDPPSPLIVSASRDVSTVPGLRHEAFLFSSAAVLLAAFGAALCALAFA